VLEKGGNQLVRSCEELIVTDCIGGRDCPKYLRGRKANWIGNVWRRDSLLIHVTEGKKQGKIEVNGIRGRC